MKLSHKQLKAECDKLWAIAVKLKAGNVSEWSGKNENGLHAHHIRGRGTCYRLRYELKNGIALTPGEHKFIAHNESRRITFEDRIKELRGKDVYDRLDMLKRVNSKTYLPDVKIYLKEVIRRLEASPV